MALSGRIAENAACRAQTSGRRKCPSRLDGKGLTLLVTKKGNEN